MSMDFYLPRADQKRLQEKLNQIPALVEDLSVTITQQARISRPGLGRLKHQKPGSRLPFNLAAAAAGNELDRCLAGWVHFVCQHRKIRYEGPRSVLSHANWLKRHLVILALIEGSEGAYEDIAGVILACQSLIDLPPDDDIPHMDSRRVARANRQVLTAGQVAKIASKLGERGRKLTVERIHTLSRNGHLRPVKTDRDTGTKFYRLGDVLHAHKTCQQRSRKATSEKTQ
jgi:hypothetical protein